MPRLLKIGALSPESRAAEDLALPFLEGVDVGAAITNALDFVAATRRAAAVLAPKGSGKSDLGAVAVAEFDEAEAAKQAADATYAVRRVEVVRAPRTSAGAGGGKAAKGAVRLLDARGVLLAVLGALLGDDTPSDRAYGRRMNDKELSKEAVDTARAQHVAVIMIEEAEQLGPAGFTALRDFMADAEAAAPGRLVVDPRTGARTRRSGGVGVLLLGTPNVRATLEASDEAGERWATVETVPGLAAADLADVLLRYFPAFAAAERAYDAGRGRGAWRAEVVALVAQGRPTVSLRQLDTLARDYFRTVVRNLPPEAAAPTRETVPFDPGMFLYVADRTNWHRPGAGDGSTPRPAPGRDAAALPSGGAAA